MRVELVEVIPGFYRATLNFSGYCIKPPLSDSYLDTFLESLRLNRQAHWHYTTYFTSFKNPHVKMIIYKTNCSAN